tara:strand:- start:31 stop:795 length:765 start_codon:yes stop_codon:yes gene_type:complete
MSIAKRPDCNFNLENVKFKEGQKYYIMKLQYHEGFGKLNRVHDLTDRIIKSVLHYYILIDTINKNNKKCYTSFGLIKERTEPTKNQGRTEIQSPDLHVSICGHLINKNEFDFFKNLPCLPNKNTYLRGNKRYWGKKIKEGKLNKFQIKFLNFFINNSVKRKLAFGAVLPFKFSLFSKVCNLTVTSGKVNYFNCHNFANKFHKNPEKLYNDIIKFSEEVNFDKIIDPESGKIYKLNTKKGKQILKKYEEHINENK